MDIGNTHACPKEADFCLEQSAITSYAYYSAIRVCHFPPGTSKWNKIEHRMSCHITENWRGRPLVSHEVVVNLIGSTHTRTGLQIQAELDTNTYETAIKVTNKELEAVRSRRIGSTVSGTTP